MIILELLREIRNRIRNDGHFRLFSVDQMRLHPHIIHLMGDDTMITNQFTHDHMRFIGMNMNADVFSVLIDHQGIPIMIQTLNQIILSILCLNQILCTITMIANIQAGGHFGNQIQTCCCEFKIF